MDELAMLGFGDEAGYDDEELTDDERRWARAVSERQVVVPTLRDDGTATGVYEVFTQSRSRYAVEPSDPACSCPDFVFRGGSDGNGCKHIRRVTLLSRVDPDFPGRGDDAEAYVERLGGLVETLRVRRDLLGTEVFDEGEIAVEPSAPVEDYRLTDWFVEQLTDHDSLG